MSYAVCRAFEMDCSTRSSDYIQLYQGDADVLTHSLQRIQQVAARIIKDLKAESCGVSQTRNIL